MELTIEQALRKGIALHKNGKLADAERLYRSILQKQPMNPNANHNLGLIALSVDKTEEALSLLKNALDANPNIEQFWLSYIQALIKEGEINTAKEIIGKAKKYLIDEEKLHLLEIQQVLINQNTNTKSYSPPNKQLNNLNEYYQAGMYEDAENLAISITKEFPMHQFGWKVLGALFRQTNRLSDSLVAYQKSVQLEPQDSEAHYNLGNTLKSLNRLKEAEESYRKALTLKADFSEAHNDLGVTLQDLGKLNEAAEEYKKAISLKSDFTEAQYNLGRILRYLGRLDDAEANLKQAIALKPDFALAYNELGATLQDLGRLDESEEVLRQALLLNMNYAEAHNNLGNTLYELARHEEAEASLRQAIALKPSYAMAYSSLGCVMYEKEDIYSALNCFKKAFSFDSRLRINDLRMKALKSREHQMSGDPFNQDENNSMSHSEYIILNRAVEIDLVDKLYAMKSKALDSMNDSRYGNGSCSPDFQLFDDESGIIKNVSSDLIRIISDAVKSKAYIYDSFFNILGAGGGSSRHNHVAKQDNPLNLERYKYSLVYYLSVGDQNCSQPGILKMYSPDESILPRKGMVVILPSTRDHSAVYGGKTDRVIIGVNFYAF